MEQNYILGGIIFLVSFGILVYWVVNILIPMVYENNERAACRTSIDINAKRFTDPLFGAQIVGGLIDVNCKTIEKELKGDTREKVFGQLADLMAMAWQDVRSGKKKIFDDDTAVFCMPRYAPIKFEEKNKVYPNFYAYLANEKPVGGQETYTEFLMNRPLSQKEIEGFTKNVDYINSNIDYGIIFVLAKKTTLDNFFDKTVGPAIATIVTVAVVAVAVLATVPSGGTIWVAAGSLVPSLLIGVGSTGGLIVSGAVVTNLAIGGAVLAATGGAAAGLNWLSDPDMTKILNNDLTSSYNIGAVGGNLYAAQLYLVPYDTIAALDCDKLKLKRAP